MTFLLRSTHAASSGALAFSGCPGTIEPTPRPLLAVWEAPGMSAALTHHAYGKSHVRLTKVVRHADRHDLKDLCAAVELEGDFGASYVHGDNSRVVATDTMKNVVFALAKNHALADLESFGQALAGHFLQHYAQVSTATIRLVEQPWQRLVARGRKHPFAFVGGGSEKRTCMVRFTRQGLRVESGLDDLALLKTTDSAFAGFVRDAYTTLPEADDRIFATVLSANWLYAEVPADWDRCHHLIRQALLDVFARHKSLSVQHTLHAMGAAALEACSQVEQISLRMPNKHRLLVNLQPFGLENNNEIFVATDEPFGVITGTMRRG
jgi:urate oxidase